MPAMQAVKSYYDPDNRWFCSPGKKRASAGLRIPTQGLLSGRAGGNKQKEGLRRDVFLLRCLNPRNQQS
jgi:hypothetical protein